MASSSKADQTCNSNGLLNLTFEHERMHRLEPTIAELPLFTCKICGKQLSYKSSCQYIRLHSNPKSFECGTCKQRFLSRHNKDRHESIHSGQGPFKCEICGRQFSMFYLQLKHRETHSTTQNPKKPFQCAICCKRFATEKRKWTHQAMHFRHDKSENQAETSSSGDEEASDIADGKNVSVENHFRLTHSGGGRFECDICGKRYANICSLRMCRSGHLVQTPFGCRICGKRFSAPSTLCEHRQKAHTSSSNIDPAKPFECDLCCTRFDSEPLLRKHHRCCTHTMAVNAEELPDDDGSRENDVVPRSKNGDCRRFAEAFNHNVTNVNGTTYDNEASVRTDGECNSYALTEELFNVKVESDDAERRHPSVNLLAGLQKQKQIVPPLHNEPADQTYVDEKPDFAALNGHADVADERRPVVFDNNSRRSKRLARKIHPYCPGSNVPSPVSDTAGDEKIPPPKPRERKKPKRERKKPKRYATPSPDDYVYNEETGNLIDLCDREEPDSKDDDIVSNDDAGMSMLFDKDERSETNTGEAEQQNYENIEAEGFSHLGKDADSDEQSCAALLSQITQNCCYPGCGTFCSTTDNLRAHIETEHLSVDDLARRLTCDICGKLFATLLTKQRHRVVAHSDPRKPFACETCGTRFASNQIRQRHQVVHTGEWPYACDECGMPFSLWEKLQVHVQRHFALYRAELDDAGCRPPAKQKKKHKRNMLITDVVVPAAAGCPVHT